MRLTNSARQEAGLFQNIQTVPLCWNGAESLLAVAAGSRGHLTASPAMVTGAVAEMPSTLPPAVRGIGPHLAPCPRPAKGSWHAATHGAPSRAVRGNVSQAPHRVLGRSTTSARPTRFSPGTLGGVHRVCDIKKYKIRNSPHHHYA